MRTLMPIVVGGALALSLAIAPGADAAKTTLLKGDVVSAPYSGRGVTAVPVLLSRTATKRARLGSPVGVLVVGQRRTVRVSGGVAVLPAKLRPGDRIAATVSRKAFSKSVRSSPYWRVKAKKLAVTGRAADLSTAELADLVAKLRRDLDSLTSFTFGLAANTSTQFQLLRGDVTGVRADIARLRADLDGLTAGLAALRSRLGLP